MKNEAWLLDEDILIYGYAEKDIFYPESKTCGFDYQTFKESDVGIIVFYNVKEAIKKYGNIPIITE